jgi:hypothetical protein
MLENLKLLVIAGALALVIAFAARDLWGVHFGTGLAVTLAVFTALYLGVRAWIRRSFDDTSNLEGNHQH